MLSYSFENIHSKVNLSYVDVLFFSALFSANCSLKLLLIEILLQKSYSIANVARLKPSKIISQGQKIPELKEFFYKIPKVLIYT